MRPQKLWIRRCVTRARWDEAGATAVEYGLMIIMVAFVILFAAAVLGGKVSTWYATMAIQL